MLAYARAGHVRPQDQLGMAAISAGFGALGAPAGGLHLAQAAGGAFEFE